MRKFWIKLVVFSCVFILVSFVSELIAGNLCGHIHLSQGIICGITFSILLYVSLIMSALLAWKTEVSLSMFSGLIPIPMFIYNAVHMKVTGISSQLHSQVIDIFQHYLFSYILPCLIVAVVVSCATKLDQANAS